MQYNLNSIDYDFINKGSVVMVTGNENTAVLCSEVVDELRKMREREVGFANIWVCDSLEEFERKARTPAFFSTWWYTGSLDKLSLKDKGALVKLMQKPVGYGIAVLTGLDFREYRRYMKEIKGSVHIHEVQTSFPSKRYLYRRVARKLEEHDCVMAQGTMDMFIMKLGERYNDYDLYLDRLVEDLPNTAGISRATSKTKLYAKDVSYKEDTRREITLKHLTGVLKGVHGASFDDFMRELLKPMKKDDMARSTKLFKAYGCMLEIGALKTLKKLRYRVKQYIVLRLLINDGYIPVGARELKVEAFKELWGGQKEDLDAEIAELEAKAKREEAGEEDEDEIIKKKKRYEFKAEEVTRWSDNKFNREVSVAMRLPLADWYYMWELTSKNCRTDLEAEMVLFQVVTRSQQDK